MGSRRVEHEHRQVRHGAGRTLRNALLAAVVLLMANPAQGAFIGLGYWSQDFIYSPDGATWSAPLADMSWNTFYDVVWGNEWVAVGSNGAIHTSPDGRTWTPQATGTWWTFNAVDYGTIAGSGLYVAVGPMVYMGNVPFTGTATYAQEVYTSPNGVAWSVFNTPFTTTGWDDQLRGIAYGTPGGTGTFVTVDSLGQVFLSSDGASWVPTVVANPAGGNVALNSVDWGANKYVAVGDSGLIRTSLDGIAWTDQVSGTGARLADVTYDPGTGRWMAVGDTIVLTSPDGITWTALSTPVQPVWNGWQGVTRGNGLWVVVASQPASWSESYAAVLTSPDGVTWTQRIANAGWGGFEAVAYANGQFLAVGYPFGLSSDGIEWGPGNTAALGNVIDVAYNGQMWVMVPQWQGMFLTSTDGLTWRFRDSGQSWISPTSVSWGANQWVVVGWSGLALTSPDGVQWTRQTVSTNAWPSFLDVAFRAGQWVAAGWSGQVYTSPDGVDWTKRTSGTSNSLYDVVWGGDKWVAVGEAGVIITSEDGKTWTKRTSGTSATIAALDYDGSAPGDKFAAMPWTCCSSSEIVTSADGVTWDSRDTGMFASGWGMMGGLAKDDGAWAIVPYFGSPMQAQHTTDLGAAWTPAPLPGYPYITRLNTDRLQPLHCLPEMQIVGLNETARIDGGGGRWPYTWQAPGSNSPAAVTGVTGIDRSYATETIYSVLLSDSSGASVECSVHAMKNPPPPPPPPPGPQPRCGYSITTTVPGLPGTNHDPDLYDWQELDPGQGGDGRPMKWQYRAWWWNNQLVDAPWAANWYPYPVKDDAEPFGFEFCGSKYDTVVLSAQGVACFENTDESIESDVFPWWGLTSNCYGGWAQHLPTQNTWTAHPAVFGLGGYHSPYDGNWPPTEGCANNDPSTCLFYKVEGAAPNRVLIFEENEVPTGWACPSWAWWCTPGPLARQSFQIKLHEGSGCVEVHYKHIESNTNDVSMNYPMVAGYQNEDATLGYEEFYHDYYWWDPQGYPWTHEEEAWRACPFGAAADRPKFNEDQTARSFNVTKNDNGAGEAITIVAWTNTTRGTLTRGPGAGDFTYRPGTDAAGYDTFTYTIRSTSGRTSTGNVNITLNPVNDAPAFEYTTDRIVFDPRDGPITVPGFAHLVQPGPGTAVDEADQAVTFRVGPSSSPLIFADGPTMERTAAPDSTVTSGPLMGDHAVLRFTPSGATGKSRVCMQAVDTGGNATVTNSWGESVQGQDVGERCIDMVANAPPVAFFEPSSPTAAPGVRVTMLPCPRPAPDCTHDPDGAIVRWLWEFGDGTTSGAESPSHAFRGPGVYRVKLTVWDGYAAMASTVRTVTIDWPEAAPLGDEGGSAAPVADAGPDRTVLEGTLVELQGLQAGGGLGAVPAWSQLAGIPVALSAGDTLAPRFKAPLLPTMEPVDLVFGLRLSQGAATGASDYVVVHVVSANRAPAAEAGPTLTVEPGARVALDASASSDADGNALAYRWDQVLAPGALVVVLEDASSVQASFTAPTEPASLQFRLRVDDGKATGEDLVTVHVRPAPAPAVAKARDPGPDALPHSSAAALEARQWAALAWAGAAFLLVALAAVAFVVRRAKR